MLQITYRIPSLIVTLKLLKINTGMLKWGCQIDMRSLFYSKFKSS